MPFWPAGMRIDDRFRAHVSVSALVCVTLTAALLVGCNVVGNQQGYEPEQPIAYSHAVHAGRLQIDCLYCHFGAERSRHAGVPPAQVCMNCHSQIKRDAPDVQKIDAAVESGTPIAWTRVHRFPDHAYFDHSRHVAVAAIQCQSCHGPVETMTRVRQVGSMSMGFCLDCHRKSERSGNGPAASTDCSTCHY